MSCTHTVWSIAQRHAKACGRWPGCLVTACLSYLEQTGTFLFHPEGFHTASSSRNQPRCSPNVTLDPSRTALSSSVLEKHLSPVRFTTSLTWLPSVSSLVGDLIPVATAVYNPFDGWNEWNCCLKHPLVDSRDIRISWTYSQLLAVANTSLLHWLAWRHLITGYRSWCLSPAFSTSTFPHSPHRQWRLTVRGFSALPV